MLAQVQPSIAIVCDDEGQRHGTAGPMNKHAGVCPREPLALSLSNRRPNGCIRRRVSGPLGGNALGRWANARLKRCALRSSAYSSGALHHNAKLPIGCATDGFILAQIFFPAHW